MFRIIPILILLLASGNSSGQCLDQNDYQVYSDFLFSGFENSPSNLYVIQQVGIYPKIGVKIRILLNHPELDSLVTDTNLAKCVQIIRTDTRFTEMVIEKKISSLDSTVIFEPLFQKETILVSPETIRQLFSEEGSDGWTCFHEQYKNSSGLIKFSRIAFSLDHTLAVVYVERQSGGLDGEGNLHLLEYKDGRWRIIYQQMIWIS
ncbi:MAG: hypothetical protein K9H64_23695 [Bacteroidales bacterium]|nr:hypothetical protein [Bacteroidales bacterium]MCF8459054.1 hypothetical protein [Bacteroidales bacterium]